MGMACMLMLINACPLEQTGTVYFAAPQNPRDRIMEKEKPPRCQAGFAFAFVFQLACDVAIRAMVLRMPVAKNE